MPLSARFRHWLKRTKEKRLFTKRIRPAKQHKLPVHKRIKHYFQKQKQKYALVFSSKYLIITVNSTVLYLAAFFLIHFLTQLITSISAWFCDISTTINYTFVDFHIRYWNWTEEKVIIVFSIPALFSIVVALFASLPFVKRRRVPGILKRLRYLTKKQRRKHSRARREKQIELQVRRFTKNERPSVKRKIKKRLSWPARLFMLWILYHSITYFSSGLLYAFLFHRRFGYVIWYAFNMYLFDILFSVVAFLLLVGIGYIFAVQFFYSARMYLNDLNDRNRMPFIINQAIFPFIIGTIITIALQIPSFDPAMILLNFSIFFLLLPLPSRVARFDNLHFDTLEKPVKIYWKWVIWSSVIVFSILLAVKIGIPIRIP
jgi:hypothetical protein